MDAWNTARSLLPEALAEAIKGFPTAEEIRLRVGRKLGLVIAGKEIAFDAVPVKQDDLLRVLEKATGASLHAAVPALRSGYIAYRGLRLGVCGEAVYTGGSVSGLRSFSSMSIRIPHVCPDECGAYVEALLRPRPVSTLIAAPPGVGKTTFLRELIRRTADSFGHVAVIDERNELSACYAGEAHFDLGRESDVLIGVPKPTAAMMLLRGMNPQVIAMDEITQAEDLQTAEQAAGCGVLLYATVHGRNAGDMMRRPLYRKLLESGIFQELVTIRCLGEKRVYGRETLQA